MNTPIGWTRRDEFASRAMQAILSQCCDKENGRMYINIAYGTLAQQSYDIAMSMMREKNHIEKEAA